MKKLFALFVCLTLLAGAIFAAGKGETMETTRPIWLWGIHSAFGEYSEAALVKANEWAMKNFGATFKISSLPEGSTSYIQSLNLLQAEGKFPDIITNMWVYTDESKKHLAEMAAAGKILALDQYFNDPKNLPLYAQADKEYLRAYLYNGKIYALPAWAWKMKKDAPYWGNPMGNIRLDILEKYGTPTTTNELYELCKKVKNDQVLDYSGSVTIPFAIQSGGLGNVNSFMQMMNGAGWEVDAQKRLMPYWAAQEYYESAKFLNKLWREGMMNPGAFTQDINKYQEDLMAAKYAVTIGDSWNVSLMRDSVITSLADKLGKDHPDVKKAVSYQYVMLVPPVKDDPGKIIFGQAGMTFISAQNPNVLASLKMLHWYMTDEGLISAILDAGIKDVDWVFVDKPQYWQFVTDADKPVADRQQYTKLTDAQKSGGWRNAKDAETNPPKILPAIAYAGNPPYSSYYEPILYSVIQKSYVPYGMKAGVNPGEPTVLEWGLQYTTEYGKLATATPSYLQMITDIPAMESSAMATATQRITEGLAKVLTASTEAAFQTEWNSFINSLISVTNWKPIYEARQTRWQDWLKANGFDDRSTLKTVTPVAEWKKVMGW